jgi:hypothetical protein
MSTTEGLLNRQGNRLNRNNADRTSRALNNLETSDSRTARRLDPDRNGVVDDWNPDWIKLARDTNGDGRYSGSEILKPSNSTIHRLSPNEITLHQRDLRQEFRYQMDHPTDVSIGRDLSIAAAQYRRSR